MAHYDNPPITEALIDIRVEPLSPKRFEGLNLLHSKLDNEYPKKQVKHSFESTFNIESSEPEFKSTHIPIGIRCENKDKTQVVQFDLDGFSFSRLKPYTGWATVKEEARKLWELYCDNLEISSIRRIAARYINLIEIPDSNYKLEEYFTAPPKFPDVEEEAIIAGYLVRNSLRFPMENITAIITQTVPRAIKPGVSSHILDIDVFKELSMKVHTDEIWSDFETIGRIKNELFENSLTDETKGLFK